MSNTAPGARRSAVVAAVVATVLTVAIAVAPAAAAATSKVAVTGSQGAWQLTVDGRPYQVKGLTWGPPPGEAAARMPDLRDMGVNTVRTWGTDASSQPLLDAAAANGIRVVAGFWLQPGGGPGAGGCVDYTTDTSYQDAVLGDITRWVTAYRAHPGVLMWDVGNESILGMQNCFSGSRLEANRVAYATFVNRAAQTIHGIDPNHPVTSTDAWTGAWAYLKAHAPAHDHDAGDADGARGAGANHPPPAPALDLYAVNSYGSVCSVKQDWINGGYTKPYILTEGGPPGEWETAADANGVPAEPSDTAKADGYRRAWSCVTAHPGVALGATLFHYGTEADFGGVWFNLLPGDEKRLSYYAVRSTYGGSRPANTAPVISSMALGATSVPAGGTITVDARATDPDGDPITYGFGLNSTYVDGSGAIAAAQATGTGPFRVTAPQRLGVWKLYLYARDGHGNVGIEARSVRVVAPAPAGTNVARGRPATASSYQQQGDGAPFPPGNATDGSTATRWASDWSDPQWLRVDLGTRTTFQHVQLVWEAAYGKAYQLQVSDDATTWRTVWSTTSGDGGADDVDVTATGRYVRVYGTQRGTGYGYALYELGVYQR